MKKSQTILIVSVISALIVGVLIFIFRNKLRQHLFKKKLIATVKHELKRWQNATELSEKMSSTLVQYWKSVGLTFSESQMRDAAVHQKYPWSSAFISYLFQKAGAKDQFPYSASHAGYFQVAKNSRENKKAPLRGFRITDYVPKVGDIVVNTRKSGFGYDTNGHFPSHGEIVTDVGRGYIKAVGGNVGNAVSERTFKTDKEGHLLGKDFFMVIQNNITV